MTAYLNEALKEVGKDDDRAMLERLPHITLQQIRDVISRYLLPIFDSATSIGAAAVNSGKAAELEEGYKKLGFEVERRELPTFDGEPDSESGSESGSSMSGEESGDERSEDGMEDIRSP